MVIGRNNGVVGLTAFSDKKMSGLLFGPQKSRMVGFHCTYIHTTLCLKLDNYY